MEDLEPVRNEVPGSDSDLQCYLCDDVFVDSCSLLQCSCPFSDTDDCVALGLRILCPDAIVAEGATVDTDLEDVKTKLFREHLRAKSLENRLDHTPFCSACEGCLAQSRAKKHFKGSFNRGDPKHYFTVTMDQLSLTDVENSIGIGGFKYGLGICKIRKTT